MAAAAGAPPIDSNPIESPPPRSKEEQQPVVRTEVLRQCCHVVTPLTQSIQRRVATGGKDAGGGAATAATTGEASSMATVTGEGRRRRDVESLRREHYQSMLRQLYSLDGIRVAGLVGVALRCRRVQLGLSQTSLARMVGTTAFCIREIEMGLQAAPHELWTRIVTSIGMP